MDIVRVHHVFSPSLVDGQLKLHTQGDVSTLLSASSSEGAYAKCTVTKCNPFKYFATQNCHEHGTLSIQPMCVRALFSQLEFESQTSAERANAIGLRRWGKLCRAHAPYFGTERGRAQLLAGQPHRSVSFEVLAGMRRCAELSANTILRRH